MLTGIITSFLAQSYSPVDAAIIGVFVHGKAGDDLVSNNNLSIVLAAQVAMQVPVTLAKIMAQKNS